MSTDVINGVPLQVSVFGTEFDDSNNISVSGVSEVLPPGGETR